MNRSAVRAVAPVAVLVALGAGLPLATAAHADTTTITVTTTDDIGSDGAACSLRDALASAETDTAVGSCTAGSATGTDSIVIDASVAGGTITLAQANGPLTVGAQSVAVDLGGTTVSGGDHVQVFDVAAGASLALDNGFLTHGLAARGAGIDAAGSVSLNNMVLAAGVAGASVGDDTSGKGGAIAVESGGSLTATAVLISGNSADTAGGAIDNEGTTTLTASTISSNTSSGEAGAVLHTGAQLTIRSSVLATNSAGSGSSTGGGALVLAGPTTLVNDTLSGNHADSGATTLANSDALAASQVTIAGGTGPGAAVGTSGASASTQLSNSIVATPAAAIACATPSGSVTTDHVQATDNTCATAVDETLAQLALSTLGNHGGTVNSIALGDTSSAVDAGSAAAVPASTPNDGRGAGHTRVVGSAPDLGAFELNPAITGPSDATATAGNATTLTITLESPDDATPAITWETSTDGNTWSTVVGQTTTTLHITPVLGDDGRKYRAQVDAGDGNVATSRVAALTVVAAPLVTTQPSDQSVAAGTSASFTSAASGQPAPTVQWQRKSGATWNDIVGATSATYSFTTAAGDDGAQFRAVWTNGSGTDTSDPATLSITSAPLVTSQPSDQTVTAGTSASFTSAASGQPAPTVQWQRKSGATWNDIVGATSATYSFTTAAADNGAQFRAVWTNGGGTGTSDPATLTVTSAALVTTDPSSQSVAAGTSASFTSAASGLPAPTVQWQRKSGATWTDIVGATNATYSFTTAAADNGAQFRAVWTNGGGTDTSAVATLTVTSPPVVTTDPANQTVVAAASASFTSAASGLPAPTVQWQRNVSGTWTDIVGATSATYSFTTAAADNGAQFRAVWTNGTGADTSAVATLTITAAPAITTQPADEIVASGASASFTSAASGLPAPTVQWQRKSGATWSDIPSATGATYSFAPAGTDDGAQFRAVWTNGSGVATSDPATLTVTVSPLVTTDPADDSVVPGATASFSSAAAGLPAPTVQWQRNVSGTWTDIAGATSGTYSFTAAYTDNGTQLRAVWTNDTGVVTSDVATLTVVGNPPNAPTLATAAGGITHFTASWSAGAAAAGPPVTSWQLSYRRPNAATWVTVVKPASTLSATVNASASTYEVRVRGASTAGPGAWSSSRTVVVTPVVQSLHISVGSVFPYRDGFRDSTSIRVTSNVVASGRIVITNSHGTTVRTMTLSGARAWARSWTGTKNNGKRVPFGTYYVHATLSPHGTSSSTNRVAVRVVKSQIAAPSVHVDGTVYPVRDGFHDSTAIRVTSMVPASGRLEVLAGSKVRWSVTLHRATAWNVTFRGRDKSGKALKAGSYRLKVKLHGGEGSSRTRTTSVHVSGQKITAVTFKQSMSAAAAFDVMAAGSYYADPSDPGAILLWGDPINNEPDQADFSWSLPSSERGYSNVKVSSCTSDGGFDDPQTFFSYTELDLHRSLLHSTFRRLGSDGDSCYVAGTAPTAAIAGHRIGWAVANIDVQALSYWQAESFVITGSRYVLK